MSVGLYMDESVRGAVSRALLRRGVDVLRAQDDGADGLPDPQVLDRATEPGRVLFTQDDDFLAEAAHRQAAGVDFAGVIYAHQKRVSIRQCIDDLELIALAAEPAELRGKIFTCRSGDHAGCHSRP